MIKINESVTLKDLQDAIGNESFMKDRAVVHANNNRIVFVKLGNNRWENSMVGGSGGLSGIYSDQDVFDRVSKYPDAYIN